MFFIQIPPLLIKCQTHALVSFYFGNAPTFASFCFGNGQISLAFCFGNEKTLYLCT